LPRAKLHILYGSPQVEPIAHVLGQHVPVRTPRGAYVGLPCRGVKTRILRHSKTDAGSLVNWSVDEAAPGMAGELLVRGQHVCGVFGEAEGSDAEGSVVDENGRVWYRTGDMAEFDPEGGLSILGRVDSTIVRNGELVFNFHAETVMNRLPSVSSSALLGMPDPASGERVVAVVKIKGSHQAQRVREDVRHVLERAGIPVDEVLAVDAIPVDTRRRSMVEVERLRAMLERSAR
ncbi:MAG: hypothetical protein AAFY60_02405, partial [Myxococcota bacterium]